MASDEPKSIGPDQIKQLRSELLDEIKKSKTKDTWDKFGAMSPLLTALIVAFLGGWFNIIQSNRDTELKKQESLRVAAQKEQDDKRQRDSQAQAAQLQKLQTIGQFMPYLTSDNERKQKVAITAIRSVAGIELAVELAKTNDSPGTRQALASIARNSDNPKDRTVAQTALNQLKGDVLVTSEGECGPTGSGGDEITNALKNRTDVPAEYGPLDLKQIKVLENPEVPRSRKEWSAEDSAQLKQLGEGRGVSTEGYITKALKSAAETANCKFKGVEDVNWHLYLSENPDDREGLMTVITPRMRVAHRSWSLPQLQDLSRDHEKIRISGWLLYIPELGALRRLFPTFWRIEPITKIEVFRNNNWISLDEIH